MRFTFTALLCMALATTSMGADLGFDDDFQGPPIPPMGPPPPGAFMGPPPPFGGPPMMSPPPPAFKAKAAAHQVLLSQLLKLVPFQNAIPFFPITIPPERPHLFQMCTC
jgi:hypothetical protein